LVLLGTARTRPFLDLLLSSRVSDATPAMRPADFLRELLGALLLVERLALEDFEPLLRAEFRR
jgi:hypothetical protein